MKRLHQQRSRRASGCRNTKGLPFSEAAYSAVCISLNEHCTAHNREVPAAAHGCCCSPRGHSSGDVAADGTAAGRRRDSREAHFLKYGVATFMEAWHMRE